MLAQGYPWFLALACGLAPACELLPLVPLAPGLWLVPGHGGEGDVHNRGQGAHVVLARSGAGLWAVGSGATPVLGQRLRCTALRQLGQPVVDLVLPYAVAELTLGTAGLQAQRVWAHARVAQAMQRQCPHCVQRLRQRLGAAAVDLGADPVRQPTRLWRGRSGSAGPFDWWLLPRAADQWTTLLRHRASGVVLAPGLLWGDGPPDLRDTGVEVMQRTLQRLPALTPGAQRFLGQAGAPLDPPAVAAQTRYVRALAEAAASGVRDGATEGPPPALPLADHPRHALNWQRAWRQAEDAWMAAR